MEPAIWTVVMSQDVWSRDQKVNTLGKAKGQYITSLEK